jgi:TonB family protein
MKELVPYLLKASLVLAVLYCVYWLFLRKETFFALNRYYLLLIGMVALVSPLIKFQWLNVESFPVQMVALEPVRITSERMENYFSENLDFMSTIGIIYFTGVFLFSLRLLTQLAKIISLKVRHKSKKMEQITLVYLDKHFPAFSFFHLVFVPANHDKEELGVILRHEFVHVRQGHSFDLLFFELLKVILWFNPVAWITGKSIKNIHEFLADEGVLKTGHNAREYQHLLLNHITGFQQFSLSNNFNISLIKRRIIMMTKSKSNTMAKGKFLFALPAIIALLLFFSSGSYTGLIAQDKAKSGATTTQTKQDVPNEPFVVVEKMPEYPGGKEAMVRFLIENVKYPEAAKKKGTQGKVFVTFVVKSDGSLANCKVLRGIGDGCDEEALRVVKLMPKWVPGEQRGEKVDVVFNLPIQFKLDDGKEKMEKPAK